MGYYNNKPKTFDDMLSAFLKESANKNRESIREHKDSDQIKKKLSSAKQRKIANAKKNGVI